MHIFPDDERRVPRNRVPGMGQLLLGDSAKGPAAREDAEDAHRQEHVPQVRDRGARRPEGLRQGGERAQGVPEGHRRRAGVVRARARRARRHLALRDLAQARADAAGDALQVTARLYVYILVWMS